MRHPGFEPGTPWLKVMCSTNWANIPCLISSKMPRAGIEPATRGFSVLCSTNWAIWARSTSRTLKIGDPHFVAYETIQFVLLRIAGTGFEPMTFGLWARRASRLLHPVTLFFKTTYKILTYTYFLAKASGWGRIRTFESVANRFTVCPLWPLGNPSKNINQVYRVYFIQLKSRWSDSNR